MNIPLTEENVLLLTASCKTIVQEAIAQLGLSKESAEQLVIERFMKTIINVAKKSDPEVKEYMNDYAVFLGKLPLAKGTFESCSQCIPILLEEPVKFIVTVLNFHNFNIYYNLTMAN